MNLESHTTPASNAGFQYQFDRALLALAKSHNGDCIGIETLDDVSIQSSNGELILEQDKISLQDNMEIFDNRSRNLWNTLSTWISAIKTSEIVANRTKFLLVTNKECNSSIVLSISNAKTDDEAENCISLLKKEAETPTKTLKQFMDNVLADDCHDLLRQLIIQIELIESSDSESMLEEIKKHIQIPSSVMKHIDAIILKLSGWLHQAVMQAWSNKTPAKITHQAFVNQIYSTINSLEKEKFHEKLKHLIIINPSDISAQKEATFVKQLELITNEDELITDSIEDYLRCNSERTRLSLEGEITNDDWIDFEAQLLDRWKISKRRVIESEKEKSEREQGVSIFFDLSDFKASLAGVPTTQTYLSQGSLHRMADEKRVGWHPRYEELLK